MQEACICLGLDWEEAKNEHSKDEGKGQRKPCENKFKWKE